ncbi:MAG: hypothetical protein QOI66_3631 [Myxococcales bacterium]|nr:hypothetical protein [Myxococcales bacterium]
MSQVDLAVEQPNRQMEGGTVDKDPVDAGPVDAPPVETGSFEVAVDDAPTDTASVEVGADRGTLPGDAPGMRCNGYQELCDRRFDQVVFATAHNAMSNADDGWVFPDQTHSIARQLEDGIRAMLIDTYSYLGASYLCHTSCLLGNKKLADALGEMATFLRAHPNEVLTLDIEDHLSAADTEAAFVSSGLADLVYVHPTGAPWPTLRTMIESGHRVLVGAENGQPPPAWFHHFYDLAWDTPYTFKTPADFSCAQNRGTRTNALFLLNHWLENPLPDETLSQTANAHDTLLGRARQCQRESGKLPNFVAVNHYSTGDLFQVVRELNGL